MKEGKRFKSQENGNKDNVEKSSGREKGSISNVLLSGSYYYPQDYLTKTTPQVSWEELTKQVIPLCRLHLVIPACLKVRDAAGGNQSLAMQRLTEKGKEKETNQNRHKEQKKTLWEHINGDEKGSGLGLGRMNGSRGGMK